ncbi:universal stress protein [Piscinibacter defluvii]|uniref:universal stress protein n=1 Tax=Piscinibacter defluvii TaxID=1796922 RepID=UPI000FDE424F|nr:universal stress protein [Piscinibacter defluvii]
MRILMPVDASEFSKAAVSFVASRATLLKNPTEVELINVQYPVSPRVSRAAGKEIVQCYHEAEAAKALKSAAAALKRAGANATARYVVGTVAHDLGSIVANDRADLIVMGSHGDTGLKKLLLGSVASTVAVACTKPLLILRGAPIPRRDSLKVGIALDGSPYGLAVARFVAGHRDLFGASPSVSLIHVVPDLAKISVPGWIEREVQTGLKPEQAEAMQKAAFENVFKPAQDLLARAGIAATEVRLVGQVPGDAIASQATKSRLDLLAMGSLGFGASRHSIMGSVATRVASRCRTALLLVREK